MQDEHKNWCFCTWNKDKWTAFFSLLFIDCGKMGSNNGVPCENVCSHYIRYKLLNITLKSRDDCEFGENDLNRRLTNLYTLMLLTTGSWDLWCNNKLISNLFKHMESRYDRSGLHSTEMTEWNDETTNTVFSGVEAHCHQLNALDILVRGNYQNYTISLEIISPYIYLFPDPLIDCPLFTQRA